MSALPPVYGITAAALFPGVDAFLERLAQALASGLRLLQVRDKHLAPSEREDFAARCVEMCRGHGCRVLVNDGGDIAGKVGADGVHVPSSALRNTGPQCFDGLVGVSCHSADELEAGLDVLGADFAVLSPVGRTLTHVDSEPLGWDGFAELAARHDKPVYALGGLSVSDADLAISHGACGVASMRDVWGEPAQADGAAAQ